MSPRETAALEQLRIARRAINAAGRLGFGDLFWPDQNLSEACAAIDGAARSIIGNGTQAPAAPEVERR